MTQLAMSEEASRLQASSTNTNASAKSGAGERLTRPSQETHGSEEGANPIYILGGITLGIPILAMILLIGTNPGIQEGTLTTLMMFVVFPAFIIAMIFEIKRIAGLPSDRDHS